MHPATHRCYRAVLFSTQASGGSLSLWHSRQEGCRRLSTSTGPGKGLNLSHRSGGLRIGFIFNRLKSCTNQSSSHHPVALPIASAAAAAAVGCRCGTWHNTHCTPQPSASTGTAWTGPLARHAPRLPMRHDLTRMACMISRAHAAIPTCSLYKRAQC